MKKLTIVLVIGMLLISGAVFAQSGGNAQSNNPDNFARGGYTGPVLGIITIEDLLDTVPNQFVIVEGYIIQQRVPGTYLLADDPNDHYWSVVIRLNPYFWSNLQVDNKTPVLVYGTVNRSEMRIEIEATRVEIKQ